MKRKWYSMLLRASDGPDDGQDPTARAVAEPESAFHTSDPETADVRPADAPLLEEYRKQLSTRYTGEYTILKVAQMLQSEYMRPLPEPAKRAAILVALQAAGVKVSDVIDDAVQRREVLANAERSREKALREFETRKEEANRKLQAMVESVVAEYDARIQRTKEEVSAERDKFTEWKQAKAQEEQKIAEAVSYLANGNGPPAQTPSGKASARRQAQAAEQGKDLARGLDQPSAT